MKFTKALLSLLLVCVGAVAFAQTPNTTTQSNSKTTTDFLGPVSSNGYKAKFFPDIATLNAQPYLRGIPGLVVKVGDILYYRSTDTTTWIAVGSTASAGFTDVRISGDSSKFYFYVGATLTDSVPTFISNSGDTCILQRDSSNGKRYVYINPNCRTAPVASTGLIYANPVLNDTAVTLMGTTLWQRNGVQFSNSAMPILRFPRTAVGYTRMDFIRIRLNNTIDTAQGIADTALTVPPALQIGDIVVATVTITNETVVVGPAAPTDTLNWRLGGNNVISGSTYQGTTSPRSVYEGAAGRVQTVRDSTGITKQMVPLVMAPVATGNSQGSNLLNFQGTGNTGTPYSAYIVLDNSFGLPTFAALKLFSPGFVNLLPTTGLVEIGGTSPSVRGQTSLKLYNTSTSQGITMGNDGYQTSGDAYRFYGVSQYGNAKFKEVMKPNGSTIWGDSVLSSMLSSSVLAQWNSTTQGLLFPRMTGAQMNAIVNPATNLLVICTDSTNSPFCYYNGTAWRKIGGGTSGGGTSGWGLTGTAGTDTTTNFIGTTDGNYVQIRSNNLKIATFGYDYSVALGYYNNAAGAGAIAAGYGSQATTLGAFSFGIRDTSNGQGAMSGGTDSKASGDFSLAVGQKAKASGSAAVALNAFTNAAGDYSMAIGTASAATGENSFSGGVSSTATGANSFSFGDFTFANGSKSLAMGAGSVANGENSVALNTNTAANSEGAFAINSNTVANGESSLAAGVNTRTEGNASSAFGEGVISKSYGQIAVGTYNDTTDAVNTTALDDGNTLFSVGYGTSDDDRKNALTVKGSGFIGFNTISPSVLADFNGDTRFRGNGTPGTGKVPTGTDADGNWTWQTGGGGGGSDSIFFATGHTVVGDTVYLDSAINGFGGITSSDYELFYNSAVWTQNGNDIHNTNTGNTGVNQPSPAYTLDVDGDLNITGTYRVNGTPISTGTGTVTNVATGLGLTGGPITTTGTVSVDTASASIISRQRAAATYFPLAGGNLNTGAFIGMPKINGNTIATPSSTHVNLFFDSLSRLSYRNSSGYLRTYSMRYPGDQLWYLPFVANGGVLVDSATNATAIAAKLNAADTANYMHKAYNISETVTGVKTFSGANAYGTPASITLTNATGLPISTGVSGLGTGVATFLATPTSANLAAALTNETGTGNAVFSASPTFTGLVLADSIRPVKISFAASSGTSAINMNSAGTTATDGINFGSGSIFRSASNTITISSVVLVAGFLSSNQIQNQTSANNAAVALNTTGTSITRNQADANPPLIVQTTSASSTADLIQLKTSAATVFNVTQGGTVSSTGVKMGYVSKATSYTAVATDHTIEVTATGQTITLPTAVGATGQEYTIKLTASGTSTVGTTSSQQIDGSTTYSLSAQYKYVTVQSNGANWIIIANN